MERQPQNQEFRINPENFHPCNLQGQNTLQQVSKKLVLLKVLGTLQSEYTL